MELTAYLDSQKPKYNWLFPLKVRGSAEQRIVRHSLSYSVFSSLLAYTYHAFGKSNIIALKETIKCFGHKLLIGFSFFYINQVLWGYLYKKRQQDQRQKNYRLANWPNYILSSVIILPFSIATQFIYNKKAPKKLFIRSLIDVMAVCLISLILENRIQRRRNRLLLSGWCEDDDLKMFQESKVL